MYVCMYVTYSIYLFMYGNVNVCAQCEYTVCTHDMYVCIILYTFIYLYLQNVWTHERMYVCNFKFLYLLTRYKSICIHILYVDDGKADVWSLGITLLELCEGKFNIIWLPFYTYCGT